MRLAQGLSAEQRAETLRQYIVTPQLVECFDRALSLVGSAVETNSSKGAYLPGDARGPIPIVSFIARQRDLRELVGG